MKLRSFFLFGLLVSTSLAGRMSATDPVQFDFRLAPATTQANPFARDVWAEVTLPSGQVKRLPAYHTGGDGFAVRARAAEVGEYRLGRIVEKSGATETVLVPEAVTAESRRVDAIAKLPQVGLARDRTRFAYAGAGSNAYTPIGSNLAWVPGGARPADYYAEALPRFSAEGLNWIRIWMCHWGGLNLDWLTAGASPPAGKLDADVAQSWDRIVAAAENAGVYVQLVLQHHGQYSTGVNPNWGQNPWNAANPGGFLATPADFFTSEQAREATRIKYRYTVARWGYSPAILAWELFNEVHWVDVINRQHDEGPVARWHAEMAAHLRACDAYGHLVTTSLENLRSEIYASMDYYQPHLYPYAPLTGPLTFGVPTASLARPVFYGETGDDHAPLSPEQKQSGVALVPPVWASLFGVSRYSAQPWLGADLMEKKRLGELGAVARFLSATRLAERAGLVSFSPVVTQCPTIPLVLESSQVWQRRPAPEIDLPLDGRVPLALADFPRAYVGNAESLAAGFPGRATFRFNSPRAIAAKVVVSGVGTKGSALRIQSGRQVLAEKAWPAEAPDNPSGEHPVEIPFTLAAGSHSLVLENSGAGDWFQLDRIETDLPVPVLAALGKRSDRFIAVWLWHRQGILALKEGAPAGGFLMLEDVPAGKWSVTWWNTFKGAPASTRIMDHPGGQLAVPVPPTGRHTAVVLTR